MQVGQLVVQASNPLAEPAAMEEIQLPYVGIFMWDLA